MSGFSSRQTGEENVRLNLAQKLKTARSLTGLSTRAVAAKISGRYPISHATLANYESGRSTPPLEILAVLANIYDRPINWFLESGKSLTGVRYRNLKSRVRISELHMYEAEVQRWIDAYMTLEERLMDPLRPKIESWRPKPLMFFQSASGKIPSE